MTTQEVAVRNWGALIVLWEDRGQKIECRSASIGEIYGLAGDRIIVDPRLWKRDQLEESTDP